MRPERPEAVATEPRVELPGVLPGVLPDALLRAGSAPRDAPSRWIERVGRVGLAAYGLVYLVLGGLGIKIVVNGRGRTHLDDRGAVATVASGGVVGLGMLAVGVVALTTFAVWQLRAAAVGYRWVSTSGERWRKRCGAIGKAAGVLSVSWIALRFLVRSPGDRRGVRTLCVQLFAQPGGRLLVGAVGVGALVMAVSMAVTGIRRTFMGDLVLDRLHHRLHGPARWLGSLGNLARATVFGSLGVVTVAAALSNQPDRVGGLDLALKTLAQNTGGSLVVATAAVGFAAYGTYCLLDAWARHP